MTKWLIALLVATLVGTYVFNEYNNHSMQGPILEQIKILAKTDDAVIVSHTNNHLFFGNPRKVTYTIRVNGDTKKVFCHVGTIRDHLICNFIDGADE